MPSCRFEKTGSAAETGGVPPFSHALESHGLILSRDRTTTLQVNVGLQCNQRCRHCHLEAGPERRESMERKTAEQVVEAVRRLSFQCVDITGGAPELNPHLPGLIEKLAPLTPRLMLRSNLTLLTEQGFAHLLALCRTHRVVIISSLPSTNAGQAEAQRGKGVFAKSITALTKLNQAGYGQPDTGLELHLVANPGGAFLPAAQCQAEQKFRHDLQRKYNLVFNQLFTFANVPLGRFRQWLEKSGNFESYMRKLSQNFNPATVKGLMCRSQLSVAWDGWLFDCDFNLAAGLHPGSGRLHISDLQTSLPPGGPIATDDYCYACTAGSGFT